MLRILLPLIWIHNVPAGLKSRAGTVFINQTRLAHVLMVGQEYLLADFVV